MVWKIPLAKTFHAGYGQNNNKNTHPPSPKESEEKKVSSCTIPPNKNLSREEIRFLADVAARPLSTTVSRYQRLNLSRRRGNAIQEALTKACVIERVVIATRTGQVVLYQLADLGRAVCTEQHIDPGSKTTESLEHKFWINRATKHFEKQGYEVKCEHPVKGNGAIDILASKPGQKIAVEVETGKSDIKKNISKINNAGFDRIVLVATSPTAVSACQKVIDANGKSSTVELLSWLDIS